MKKAKYSSREKRKDSGYLMPIICIALLTLLSAVLITLFISVILSSDEIPPMTSVGITVSGTGAITSTEPSTLHESVVTTTVSLSTQSPASTTLDHTSTPETSKNMPITTNDGVTTEKPSTSVSQTITSLPETTNSPQTDKPLVTTQHPDSSGNPHGFKADLSEYEQYMDPSGERWDDAYLMLVNADHTLEPDQEKSYPVLGGVVRFANIDAYEYDYYPSLRMNENAIMALTAMFIEAKSNGLNGLDVTSAYRDYAKQSDTFNKNCAKTYHWMCIDDGCSSDWIGKDSTCPICGKKSTDNSLPITQEEKEANVATYSCAPGTSDHQTGLAVDIVDTTLPSRFNHLIQEYGETESGKWLAENCWKFGFVLRFPPDKEEQTGIIYEPWHFRFVGRTHAEKMKELNMCLEEYTEYLESIGYLE